jgi:predicted metal-dependent peptidase
MSEETTPKPQLSRASLDVALANMFSSPEYQQSYVFYGHMIGQCSISIEDMPAPAAVSFHLDHYRLHVNPTLFDKFSLEGQLFVLQHEMHHILNGHVIRLEDRDHKAFNHATDCAINQLGNPKHMPQGCIVPANFPSKHKVPDKASSEQYYELIDRDQIPPEEPQYLAGGGHDKWAESQGDEELQADITKNMIEKAINQTQKSRGDLPVGISQYLDLFSRKKELDWRKLLKNYASNKKANKRKTIMRKDRRNPEFDHLKGITKSYIVTPVIVGDESGSVINAELTQAIGECLHLCKAVSADLWYIPVDSRAHTPYILKKSQRTFDRTAYGGTMLAPAIAKAKEARLNVSCYVVITDGEICESDIEAFDATNKPVIWLITSRGTLQPSMTKNRMRAFKLTTME